jgi:hypothetical protein
MDTYILAVSLRRIREIKPARDYTPRADASSIDPSLTPHGPRTVGGLAEFAFDHGHRVPRP